MKYNLNLKNRKIKAAYRMTNTISNVLSSTPDGKAIPVPGQIS
jgi:hypothetical protein